MYPSQTSLIPVTVALSRFVEVNGLSSMLSNYSFWYLGLTPYRYLTGPIIPIASATLHKLFSNVSLFDITISLVIVSYLVSVVGWGILVGKIQNLNFKFQIFGISHLAFIILLVLPWRLFSSLTLNEASITLARNFLPWVLLAFWRVLDRGDKQSLPLRGKGNKVKKMMAVLTLSLLLLINTSILPIFLVGLISLVLASSFKEGRFRGITKRVKSSLFLILYSLLLVTIWYTPGYWITVLANPSIGGASGIKVIFRIIDLLKAAVPLILAVIAVYFSGKMKSRLSIFSLTWVFTFLFLTIFRFIGDPDFWMDWTTWFSEIEVGLAIVIATNMKSLISNFQSNLNLKTQNSKPQLKSQNYLLLSFTFILLLLSFYMTWRTHLALGKPTLISREIPQGVRSLVKLAKIAGDGSTSLTTSRVFLSGSTVFWANALYDIYQVRGGRDQVAVHPTWDKGAFELREGRDPEDSLRWLQELEISYVLVHGPKSPEFYHDFRNINKWKDIGNVVWEDSGDVIYQIPK